MNEQRPPVSALLSRALVAFTIELDNEFEQRMPHFTAEFGQGGPEDESRVWLASYAMWANFLRFVPENGIRAGEFARAPGVRRHAFRGMHRWRYVRVSPSQRPRREWMVRPTEAGLRAASLWTELPAEIEARWRARFGERIVNRLGSELVKVVERLPGGLPWYLGEGDYAGFIPASDAETPPPVEEVDALALPALLSQPLQSLAQAYDGDRSSVSLAFATNLLRILDAPVRELPHRSGIAKVSCNNIVARMRRAGLVTVEPEPGASRGKVVQLTGAGSRARAGYLRRLAAVESKLEWAEAVTDALMPMIESPAFGDGLVPPPTGWRARSRQPDSLPDYPLVTHRGGYPDGS